MVTADDARALVGKKVVLQLSPAAGESTVQGTVVGKVEALDGLVLVVEPEGEAGVRRSYHYQHIVGAAVV